MTDTDPLKAHVFAARAARRGRRRAPVTVTAAPSPASVEFDTLLRRGAQAEPDTNPTGDAA